MPIGHVANDVIGRLKPGARDHQVSRIVLEPEFHAGLKDIGEFSHLWVMCWLNKVKENDRKTTKVFYPEKEVGIFATRVQFRPNPISLNMVRLVEVDGKKGTITVIGLEMFNGTPVLDIKPFTGIFKDVPRAFTEPYSGEPVRVAWWHDKHPTGRK